MLINLPGRRLYFDLFGPADAPVVAFAHSLNADGGMWAEQMPALAGWRVLRLDMRGHGGSDPVKGPYTMSALAGDIAQVLDAQGIAKVHYIGLSIGGMIGQAFALEHGGRLNSLMLCDTLPASPKDQGAAWQERMQIVRTAQSLEPLADGTMARWFTDEFPQRHPARLKQIRDTLCATTPEGYLGCAAAIQDFDFLDRLPGLRVPALVLCGADDQGTPPAANKSIAAAIPAARYDEIPAARHLPNIERPDTFNRIMMQWLTRHL